MCSVLSSQNTKNQKQGPEIGVATFTITLGYPRGNFRFPELGTVSL